VSVWTDSAPGLNFTSMYCQPTVIYLDDDEEDRAILQEVFKEESGITIIAVASENELLHHLETETVSLVLLDIHIPGTSGLEILSRIRANDATCHLKVILLSTGRRDAEVAYIDSYGGYFMAKPVTIGGFQQLISLVKTLVPNS
jgi:CheY-like chemotaxis protein